ncbi:MAG: hypothetical protein EXR28_12105 [Betaproteobacteria bacterium]|nr:hypothetical protein [Betaproteobacteria bacterium]
MFAKLFSSSKVNDFAKSLAADIAKRYPPAIANNPEQMVSHKRLTTILEETFKRAAEFQKGQKLGWFGRAKLVNEFQWELKDIGYESKFVELAAEGLLVYVTRGPDATPAA